MTDEQIFELEPDELPLYVADRFGFKCIVCDGPIEVTPRVIMACDSCIAKDPQLGVAP